MSTSLSKKKYSESEKVKNAFNEYNTYKDNNKPDDYSFSDSKLLQSTQDKYFNHADFSYDIQSDPIYNQYKELYTTQGKKAMENAIGNAASMTGGYGNSYAETVGAAAYNEHLDKLNNIIPELYATAYSRYEDELDRIENQLSYLTDKDNDEYTRYLDQYDIYSNEVDSLRNLYMKEYENDIKIQDSEWEAAYKIAMAEQEQSQFESEMQFKQLQEANQKALEEANLDYKYYTADQAQSQFKSELELKQLQEANKKALEEANLNYKYYTADQAQSQFNSELELKQLQEANKKALEEANLDYKYYMAQQDQKQFNSEMYYKQSQAASSNKYREEELRLQQEKLDSANEQYWNDYNYETREYLREDEIYTLLKNGDKYSALCAIDQKYEDDEVAKYKAYLMGFEHSYVDSYFKAKKKKEDSK